MKTALIIANCFAFDILTELNYSSSFRNEYKVDIISTYEQEVPADYVTKLNSADLIISQSVKNIPHLTVDFISKNIAQNAIFIKTEFIRFDGFWPLVGESDRRNMWLWFVSDEFECGLGFKEYMDYPVESGVILSKFDSELQKLRELDVNSDVKFYDYFVDNFKSQRFFSDYWHPSNVYIKRVAKYVLDVLGFDDLQFVERVGYMNQNRYRIILNSVCDCLDLDSVVYNSDFIYFGKSVSVERFYDFLRFVKINKLMNQFSSMTEVETLFNQICFDC